mmetsp:Transcript_8281/g.23766  ORF Transcript_8281/g.23766 Transcript_8281/m.23766 type:complete len:237 (+) Transcript_8281:1434-2144(+)
MHVLQRCPRTLQVQPEGGLCSRQLLHEAPLALRRGRVRRLLLPKGVHVLAKSLDRALQSGGAELAVVALDLQLAGELLAEIGHGLLQLLLHAQLHLLHLEPSLLGPPDPLPLQLVVHDGCAATAGSPRHAIGLEVRAARGQNARADRSRRRRRGGECGRGCEAEGEETEARQVGGRSIGGQGSAGLRSLHAEQPAGRAAVIGVLAEGLPGVVGGAGQDLGEPPQARRWLVPCLVEK